MPTSSHSSSRNTPRPHTCTIRSVTVRVAGDLSTEAFAHHFGTSSQQVGVRAGDVLTYVSTRAVAAAVADGFAAAVAAAGRHRLRPRVSPTWLGVVPGTYPPAMLLHLSEVPAVATGYQPQRYISGAAVPAHVWVRVGTVLWQVCDRAALEALAAVWADCTRLLGGEAARPHRAPVPTTEPATRPAGATGRDAVPAAAAVPPRPEGATAPHAGPPPRAATGGGARRPVDAAGDARSDTELLAAYTRGDRDALAVLFTRRRRLITHAITRTIGPRGDVDDIAQTVWLQVARRADSFAGRAEVSTWLWRIAHNTALHALRGDLPLVDPAVAGQVADPHDAYARHDLAGVVEQLLALLPPDWRAATELVDLQGYDLDTAARLLGVPRGSVASRRHRARRHMADEATRLGVTFDP